MEACLAVDKELDKVLAKFGELQQANSDQIAQLLQRVQSVTASLRPTNIDCPTAPASSPASSPAAALSKARALVADVRAVASQTAGTHRELHSTVSRVGKTVDRHFLADYSTAAVSGHQFLRSARHQQLVDEAVCRHLQLSGRAAMAQQLATARTSSTSSTSTSSSSSSDTSMDVVIVYAAAAAAGDAVPAPDTPSAASAATSAAAAEDEDDGDVSGAAEQQLYADINGVMHALCRQQLEPALVWLDRHASRLHVLDSMLEFRLRRLHFLALLQQRRPLDAVREARTHLGRFCAMYDHSRRTSQQQQPQEQQQQQRHLTDSSPMATTAAAAGVAGVVSVTAAAPSGGLLLQLRQLMGALAYVHVGVQRSPYAPLVSRAEWLEVAELFVHEASRLYALSASSPLHVALTAGCRAAPMLNHKRRAMRHGLVGGGGAAGGATAVGESSGLSATIEGKHLQVNVIVDRDYRYHSLFSCPILKQQSTEQNPPVRLTCGHCISRDALHSLSRGNKLKCPYCPVETHARDARLVFF